MASGNRKRRGRRGDVKAAWSGMEAALMGSANRAFSILARHRGQAAEQKALDALELAPPWWLHGARHATPEEDATGIDVVAHLDIGDISVQIKSSATGRRQFLISHPACHFPVVVLPPDCSLEWARGRLLSELWTVRRKALHSGTLPVLKD